MIIYQTSRPAFDTSSIVAHGHHLHLTSDSGTGTARPLIDLDTPVGMFFKLLLIHWLLALYRVSGYTLSEIHGAKKITTHLPNYKVILPSLQQASSVDESSDAGLFGSIG